MANKINRAVAGGITVICLCCVQAAYAQSQTANSDANAVQNGVAMPTHATGTFEVKLIPQANIYLTHANNGRIFST